MFGSYTLFIKVLLSLRLSIILQFSLGAVKLEVGRDTKAPIYLLLFGTLHVVI